jgi:hypothetical protein
VGCYCEAAQLDSHDRKERTTPKGWFLIHLSGAIHLDGRVSSVIGQTRLIVTAIAALSAWLVISIGGSVGRRSRFAGQSKEE